jgi:hypothetical protein
MGETNIKQPRSRQSWLLRLVGVILFGVGLLAVFMGPLEMFCFYLFTEGGVFHYEGFGFGSFMFGNISAQILGYFFIAAIALPIGYGTIRQKRWARHLTMGLFRCWYILGLPLMVAFLFVLVSSKDASWIFAGFAGLLTFACYLFLPGLAIRLYNSPRANQFFSLDEAEKTWIEAIPIPLVGLAYVFVFFILVLFTQIFFNGLFPVFGTWLTGLNGIVLIDFAMIALAIVLWGMIRLQPWAWWGGWMFFSLMFISYTLTLVLSRWDEMLVVLNIPAYELQYLEQIPFQGTFFAVLAGIPFLLTIGSILRTRSFFHR